MAVTLTPAQQETLRTYALADNTYGLAAAYTAKNDQQIADICNWVRDGVTPCPDNGIVGTELTTKKPFVNTSDIFQTIAVEDFEASPGALVGSWLSALFAMPQVPLLDASGNSNNVLTNLKAIVSGATSKAAIIALAKPPVSIIQDLFGYNQQPITTDDAEAVVELTS